GLGSGTSQGEPRTVRCDWHLAGEGRKRMMNRVARNLLLALAIGGGTAGLGVSMASAQTTSTTTPSTTTPSTSTPATTSPSGSNSTTGPHQGCDHSHTASSSSATSSL